MNDICISACCLVRCASLRENRGDWSSICCLLLSISAWLPQLKDNGWGIYYYLLVKWSGVGDKVMKLMSGRKRDDPSTSEEKQGTSIISKTWLNSVQKKKKKKGIQHRVELLTALYFSKMCCNPARIPISTCANNTKLHVYGGEMNLQHSYCFICYGFLP